MRSSDLQPSLPPHNSARIARFAPSRSSDSTTGMRLLDRQAAPIRRYLSRRVPCSADVEDLVQRTLLASIEAQPRYRHEVSLSRFVRAIARKLLLRYHRDGERARGRLDAGVQPEAVAASQSSVLARVVRAGTQDRLQRAFRELPDSSARILHLRYWDEQDTAQIGRALGLTPGAVRVRLHRARQEMKRALAGMECSASDVWPIEGV